VLFLSYVSYVWISLVMFLWLLRYFVRYVFLDLFICFVSSLVLDVFDFIR